MFKKYRDLGMKAQLAQILARAAEIEDIDRIFVLHNAWLISNISDYSDGFLSVSYDKFLFGKIIDNNDLLIFEQNGALIGYALVNTVVSTSHIDYVINLYRSLNQHHKDHRIGSSYQILLDKHIQGTGFLEVAHLALLEFYKGRYDILLSTVSKTNGRSISAHRKLQWNFIDIGWDRFIIEKWI